MLTSLKKYKISAILALLILPFICGLLSGDCSEGKASYVRVAVMQNAKTLSIAIKGFYNISDPDTGRIIFRGKNLRSTAKGYKNGISLGKVAFSLPKIMLEADDAEAIVINSRRFKGGMQLVRDKNSQISAINYIEIEDYVKGILYNEASHYWPMEALKAQAVISRSFALFKMKESSLRDYDLTSDIYSQVYGGKASERARTNLAVDQTKGLALIYKGKLFPTYFHATCGGHTEDAAILWNTDIPPLKGVTCNFCKDSPHYNWHLVISFKEIADKLAGSVYNIRGLKDIKIAGRNNSGRVISLILVGDDKDVRIPAKDFRNILGPNVIKSTSFNLSIVKQDAVFEGNGWGHGSGLCQWGAYFMSKQDYGFEQILKYYYPGADVKAFRF